LNSTATGDLLPEYDPEAIESTFRLYVATIVLMIVGILILIAYTVSIGPLVSPGSEESFGLAVALMFLMSGVAVHVVDRAYRVWPFGRRVHPTPPSRVTDASWVTFARVIVFALAVAAVAYILGSLIGT